MARSFYCIVFRVSQKKGTLHTGPGKKLPVHHELPKDAWIKVIAQSNDWYRVVTAGAQEGYIEKTNITPAESGNRFSIKKEVLLLSEANLRAVPIATITGQAIGLASYQNFRFIRTANGLTGWVDITGL